MLRCRLCLVLVVRSGVVSDSSSHLISVCALPLSLPSAHEPFAFGVIYLEQDGHLRKEEKVAWLMTRISRDIVVFLVLRASVRLRCFVSFSAFSTLSFLSYYVSGLLVKVLGGESLTSTNDIGKAVMSIGYKVIPEELPVRLRSCCSIWVSALTDTGCSQDDEPRCRT